MIFPIIQWESLKLFLWCLHCYCCVSIVNDYADTVEVNITLTSCSRSQLVRRHHVTIVNDYSDKQFKILLKLKQILLLPYLKIKLYSFGSVFETKQKNIFFWSTSFRHRNENNNPSWFYFKNPLSFFKIDIIVDRFFTY